MMYSENFRSTGKMICHIGSAQDGRLCTVYKIFDQWKEGAIWRSICYSHRLITVKGLETGLSSTYYASWDFDDWDDASWCTDGGGSLVSRSQPLLLRKKGLGTWAYSSGSSTTVRSVVLESSVLAPPLWKMAANVLCHVDWCEQIQCQSEAGKTLWWQWGRTGY